SFLESAGDPASVGPGERGHRKSQQPLNRELVPAHFAHYQTVHAAAAASLDDLSLLGGGERHDDTGRVLAEREGMRSDAAAADLQADGRADVALLLHDAALRQRHRQSALAAVVRAL